MTGSPYQVLDEVLGALEFLVLRVVAPGTVDSLAGLEGEGAQFCFGVEARSVLARQVLFEHLEIFAVKGRLMVIGPHQRLRL